MTDTPAYSKSMQNQDSNPPNIATSSLEVDMMESTRKKNFAENLHALLAHPSTQDIMCWTPNGDAFCILNQDLFVQRIMPKHFQHAMFESFSRRLRRWGFKRVDVDGTVPKFKGMAVFHCKNFQRGKPELCKLMCDDRQLKKKKKRKETAASAATNADEVNAETLIVDLNASQKAASCPATAGLVPSHLESPPAPNLPQGTSIPHTADILNLRSNNYQPPQDAQSLHRVHPSESTVSGTIGVPCSSKGTSLLVYEGVCKGPIFAPHSHDSHGLPPHHLDPNRGRRFNMPEPMVPPRALTREFAYTDTGNGIAHHGHYHPREFCAPAPYSHGVLTNAAGQYGSHGHLMTLRQEMAVCEAELAVLKHIRALKERRFFMCRSYMH